MEGGQNSRREALRKRIACSLVMLGVASALLTTQHCTSDALPAAAHFSKETSATDTPAPENSPKTPGEVPTRSPARRTTRALFVSQTLPTGSAAPESSATGTTHTAAQESGTNPYSGHATTNQGRWSTDHQHAVTSNKLPAQPSPTSMRHLSTSIGIPATTTTSSSSSSSSSSSITTGVTPTTVVQPSPTSSRNLSTSIGTPAATISATSNSNSSITTGVTPTNATDQTRTNGRGSPRVPGARTAVPTPSHARTNASTAAHTTSHRILATTNSATTTSTGHTIHKDTDPSIASPAHIGCPSPRNSDLESLLHSLTEVMSKQYRCDPGMCVTHVRVCWPTDPTAGNPLCDKHQFDDLLTGCGHQEAGWLASLTVRMEDETGVVVNRKLSSEHLPCTDKVVLLFSQHPNDSNTHGFDSDTAPSIETTYAVVPTSVNSTDVWEVERPEKKWALFLQLFDLGNDSIMLLKSESPIPKNYLGSVKLHHTRTMPIESKTNPGGPQIRIEATHFTMDPSQTCATLQDTDPSAHASMATIIGCSVGGLLFVILAVAMVCGYRRRRRQKRATMARYLNHANADRDFSDSSLRQYLSLTSVSEDDNDDVGDLPPVEYLLGNKY